MLSAIMPSAIVLIVVAPLKRHKLLNKKLKEVLEAAAKSFKFRHQLSQKFALNLVQFGSAARCTK